jgi:hypothetical protein
MTMLYRLWDVTANNTIAEYDLLTSLFQDIAIQDIAIQYEEGHVLQVLKRNNEDKYDVLFTLIRGSAAN